MIIVEGVDGAGKTTLIERLCGDLNLPLHPRASSSISGPVKDLFEWAADDVLTMAQQPFSLYDRHPLVSEYIYGPITRGQIDPRFFDRPGREITRLFKLTTLVIFCDPGIETVLDNLKKAPQMPGVWENITTLHLAYRVMKHNWNGHAVDWDYIDPGENSYAFIRDVCLGHRRAWENRLTRRISV